MAQPRQSPVDFSMAPGFGMSNGSSDYSTQSRPAKSGFGTAWDGKNIWAAPIGTGKKDTLGPTDRVAPLRSTFGSTASLMSQGIDSPSEIKGSSSLLASSHSDGPSLGWPQLGSTQGANNGRGRAAGYQASRSPVRQPGNTLAGDAPSFTESLVMGPPQNNKPATHLDPSVGAFAPRNVANNVHTYSHQGEDQFRSKPANLMFGNPHGFGSKSGYASSAASRNGSLPPSRHEMQTPASFSDFGFNNEIPDIISHRVDQQSRTSNYPISKPVDSRLSNDVWQLAMDDITSDMDAMDVRQNGHDRLGSSYWFPNSISSPGSVNGLNNTVNWPRSGSLSYERGTNLMNTSYDQPQHSAYGQGSSYSPTGSAPRYRTDTPNSQNMTPPIHAWRQGLSSHNSNANLQGYGNYGLPVDHLQLALNQYADTQGYQPSPALSYRSMQSNGYTMTGSSTPNYRQGSQLLPYHNQNMNGYPYGQNLHSARHPPRGPAANQEKKGSPLLQEFHMSKGNKKYEIKDLYGHIVEFCGDQHGSRFLQTKLESANSDEKAQIFNEVMPNAVQLMTDLFGNYVMQKLFEHGNQQQKRQLADQMKGNVKYLTTQMYACRVVQRALDVILIEQQASLIKELDGTIVTCVKDQNGNHVIQKAVERIPSQYITFITGAFTGKVHELSTHNYGCRVIQRMLESSHEPAKSEILDELHNSVSTLIVDQFGNYVTQNIIKHGRPSDRDKVIAIVTSNLVNFATQKYASNVVETGFVYGSYEQRQKMIGVVTSLSDQGEVTAIRLMRDQFGNYIIQRFITHLQEVATREEYDNFINMLQPQLDKLKTISYGKQVGQIEKMIMAGRRGSTPHPSPLSQEVLAPLDVSSIPTPALTNEDAQSPRSSSHQSTQNDGHEPETMTTPGATEKAPISIVKVTEDDVHERITPAEA